MVKKLTKLGNSLGLVIDKPILDLLKITPDTPLEITTDGTRIILTPVAAKRARALAAARKVMREQSDTLKKLAK